MEYPIRMAYRIDTRMDERICIFFLEFFEIHGYTSDV